MYELCLLKKEQKEENEELSKIIRVEKSKKEQKQKRVLEIYAEELYPTAGATTILLFLKDNINQDSKIMMMNVYLAAALAVVPTLFSPSFLRIFNLPMAACIL